MGLKGPHVIFRWLQTSTFASGSGFTDDVSADPNVTGSGPFTGLGNLVIGYDEVPFGGVPAGGRGGSHNLVIGPCCHRPSSFGGLVAGVQKQRQRPERQRQRRPSETRPAVRASSVSGGSVNTASGSLSSVSGGKKKKGGGGKKKGGEQGAAPLRVTPLKRQWRRCDNSGHWPGSQRQRRQEQSGEGARDSAVTGGSTNTASGDSSSVGGGLTNTGERLRTPASAAARSNTAERRPSSSVSGGQNNTAKGQSASVSGGQDNTAAGQGLERQWRHLPTRSAAPRSQRQRGPEQHRRW